MYIRHILIVMILFFAGKVSAQDSVLSAKVLQGKWHITKVVSKTYSQQDRKLLQEKVLATTDAFKTVRGFVPLVMLFREQNCSIQHAYGVESGQYTVDLSSRLWYRRGEYKPQQPAADIKSGSFWLCKMEDNKILILEMPASYYNEDGTNLPVKLVYTCYYERAN
ncbi:hypothetical protein [Chitinophaga sp.]|uniref:hypothetical protein n=1 Tax=Chitinophaga sp. TaxID=1869181 RepID=UPI002F93DCB2